MSEVQAKKRYHKPKTILASVELTTDDTFLIAKDIFNEPTRERITNRGEKWVRFFEQNDDFLKGLIATVNNSPTLRRIIADKTNMVVGDGFIPIKGKSSSLLTTVQKPEQITGSQLEKIEDSISEVNGHGQNLVDVLQNNAFDYDAFGNCIVELVRGKVGREPFVYIYSVPLYHVAIKRAEANQKITAYGLYDNWEEVSLSTDGSSYIDKGFREVAAYPEFTRFPDGTERSIIHVKQYAPGYFYWGLPEWIGARMWAEIEYRIQRYYVSKFDNSFLPSGLLQMFGSVSPTEASNMVKGIEKKFTGTGNNHKLLVQILRDEKLKANWVPMTQEMNDEFVNLQQLAASAIVVANRWSKSLAGFATTGQLGTNQQIRQEMEYLQNTVIKQRQNTLLERIINPYLFELSKFNPALKDVQFGISNSLPVSFMGDINVEMNLTTDEKRELLGYAPMEEQISEPQNPVEDGAANPTA